MRRTMVGLLVALAGCGGGGADGGRDANAPKGVPAPVAKQVELFASNLSDDQSRAVFGTGDLAGRWELELDQDRRALRLQAPDGRGFDVAMTAARGDRLGLRDPDCSRPFTVRLTRDGEALTFTRVAGDCPETLGLLTAQPWHVA